MSALYQCKCTSCYVQYEHITCTDVEPDSECFERSSATGNVVAVTTPLCRAALVTTGVLITTDPLPRPLELGTLAERKKKSGVSKEGRKKAFVAQGKACMDE